MLSTKEAADKLNISIPRIHQLISSGVLPAQKVGRDYVILEDDLEKVKTYGKPGRPPKVKDEKSGKREEKKGPINLNKYTKSRD